MKLALVVGIVVNNMRVGLSAVVLRGGEGSPQGLHLLPLRLEEEGTRHKPAVEKPLCPPPESVLQFSKQS